MRIERIIDGETKKLRAHFWARYCREILKEVLFDTYRAGVRSMQLTAAEHARRCLANGLGRLVRNRVDAKSHGLDGYGALGREIATAESRIPTEKIHQEIEMIDRLIVIFDRALEKLRARRYTLSGQVCENGTRPGPFRLSA